MQALVNTSKNGRGSPPTENRTDDTVVTCHTQIEPVTSVLVHHNTSYSECCHHIDIPDFRVVDDRGLYDVVA